MFLSDLVDAAHPMVRLAGQVDWRQFEEALAPLFADEQGRPSADVRLAVGLIYLKYAYDLSDEGVVAAWTENPYWQYFTGGTFFEHRPPIDSSSLTNWRKRIGAAGAEQMLAATLQAGLKMKMIRPQDLKRVNVETTVQEEEIRFPTDARLYHRSLEVLVWMAKRHGIRLRQTYVRVARRSMLKLGGYAKAKQFNRAKRETKFLRTRLGRVLRDFQGKASGAVLQECPVLLDRIERIHVQRRHDKRKVYSVHAPEVECIAKGKVHKPYEFGVKVGLVSTSKGNWIVGAKAFPGNPYDRHTLQESLEQVGRLMNTIPEKVCCDLGVRKQRFPIADGDALVGAAVDDERSGPSGFELVDVFLEAAGVDRQKQMGIGRAKGLAHQGFHDGRRRAGPVPEPGDLDFLRGGLGFGAAAQPSHPLSDQGRAQASHDGFEGCHFHEFSHPAIPARDFSFGLSAGI